MGRHVSTKERVSRLSCRVGLCRWCRVALCQPALANSLSREVRTHVLKVNVHVAVTCGQMCLMWALTVISYFLSALFGLFPWLSDFYTNDLPPSPDGRRTAEKLWEKHSCPNFWDLFLIEPEQKNSSKIFCSNGFPEFPAFLDAFRPFGFQLGLSPPNLSV